MENTVTQPIGEQITVASVDVPTELWLQFRSRATLSGSTAKKSLAEALRMWLAAQPN